MEQVGKKDKLPRREILNAAFFFGIGKLLSYSLIQKGNINSNYILRTAGGKYILRAYKFKTEKEILSELHLLNYLSKKGFLCPKPVGSIYKTDKKYVCCFRYVEGRQLENITAKSLRETAKLLAKLHALTKSYKLKYSREGEGLAIMKKYLRNKKRIILASKFRDSKNFIAYLEKEIKKIEIPHSLPHGAIHADIKPENIIVDKFGKLHAIDFDNFYLDAFVVDIGDSLMWNCVEKDSLNLKKALIFLKAYDSHRKLTRAEKENLANCFKLYCLKGAFKYAYICLPRLKFAERWAYHFVRLHKNISNLKIKLDEF